MPRSGRPDLPRLDLRTLVAAQGRVQRVGMTILSLAVARTWPGTGTLPGFTPTRPARVLGLMRGAGA
jgi:hypothetical protein